LPCGRQHGPSAATVSKSNRTRRAARIYPKNIHNPWTAWTLGLALQGSLYGSTLSVLVQAHLPVSFVLVGPTADHFALVGPSARQFHFSRPDCQKPFWNTPNTKCAL